MFVVTKFLFIYRTAEKFCWISFFWKLLLIGCSIVMWIGRVARFIISEVSSKFACELKRRRNSIIRCRASDYCKRCHEDAKIEQIQLCSCRASQKKRNEIELCSVVQDPITVKENCRLLTLVEDSSKHSCREDVLAQDNFAASNGSSALLSPSVPRVPSCLRALCDDSRRFDADSNSEQLECEPIYERYFNNY